MLNFSKMFKFLHDWRFNFVNVAKLHYIKLFYFVLLFYMFSKHSGMIWSICQNYITVQLLSLPNPASLSPSQVLSSTTCQNKPPTCKPPFLNLFPEEHNLTSKLSTTWFPEETKENPFWKKYMDQSRPIRLRSRNINSVPKRNPQETSHHDWE